MSDYISREAAVDAMRIIHNPNTARAVMSVVALRELTAADVVELVRCRDCKYYMKSNEQCELVDTRLKFYSTHKRWTEESFCSWGKRKDGSDNA